MAAVTPCPSCGLPSSSAEIRCPRCNALKLLACTGACSLCTSSSCKDSDRPAEESPTR